MLSTVLYLLCGLLATLYFYLYRKTQYWKGRGLPYPKASLLFGNYKNLLLAIETLGDICDKICEQFPKEPVIGTLFGTEPAIIVKDPEILKLVLTKDFYYFNSRELGDHTHKELATQNVFSEAGDNWRVLRQNFTPLFSSAKMKAMFHLIVLNSEAYTKVLEEEMKTSDIHDIKELNLRFTMDCIGSCVFGLETNVLGNDSDKNPFREIGRRIFNYNYRQVIEKFVRTAWSSIIYALGLQIQSKAVGLFFKGLLNKVFNERNNKPGSRNDFIDYLLTFKKKDYIEGDGILNLKTKGPASEKKTQIKVGDDMLAAQCMVFFAAGFETSSTTMTFTLFELAKHQDVQQRVYEEVMGYLSKTEGKLTYECTSELPYMEACVKETLRLYPVLSSVTREVYEDYTLPSGVKLEKGVRVFIPVNCLHKNPDFYPNPLEYNPERFFGENKHKNPPYTFLPFGEGMRICLGKRFGLMQVYAGLVTILRRYRVELAPGMSRDAELEPRSIVIATKHPQLNCVTPFDSIGIALAQKSKPI